MSTSDGRSSRPHEPDTAAARASLDRVAEAASGFWIHVDADVLDPAVMPAVDSPEPEGLSLDELARILEPLVRDPRALGLEVTIYDPALDPDRACAQRLANLLERVLAGDAGAPSGKPGPARPHPVEER